MTTKRIDVVHKRGRWVAEGPKHREIATDDSKSTLVEKMAKRARTDSKKGKASCLRIHKKNGHLQEERTYSGTANRRPSKR